MSREEAITLIKSAQLMLINPTTNEPISDLHMALEMAIQALSQVTEVRKLILQAERAGVHLDYGAYLFMNALEKVVGEKQIGEFEQEPCEDAISRDAVLNTEYQVKIINDIEYVMLSEVQMKIRKMPPVTQKSESVTEFADRCRECGKMRKGHWIYDETIENWRCSKCNEIPKTMGYVGTADFMAEHFKFCNHCGRRMVEPQESEDKE